MTPFSTTTNHPFQKKLAAIFDNLNLMVFLVMFSVRFDWAEHDEMENPNATIFDSRHHIPNTSFHRMFPFQIDPTFNGFPDFCVLTEKIISITNFNPNLQILNVLIFSSRCSSLFHFIICVNIE